MSRSTSLLILLGYNGTGKSTLLKKLIEAEAKKGGKALIVTPDDIEWPEYQWMNPKQPSDFNYKGIRKCIYEDSSTMEDISKNFRDGIVALDDCRSYLNANTDQEVHRFLIRRRQMQADIIAVGHGFTEVPPKFFTFANYFILFNTQDDISERKKVMREYDRMVAAQNRINSKSKDDFHYYEIIKR